MSSCDAGTCRFKKTGVIMGGFGPDGRHHPAKDLYACTSCGKETERKAGSLFFGAKVYLALFYLALIVIVLANTP